MEARAVPCSTYAVGATDSLGSIAYFSSRGTGTSLLKPDISAPGVSVRSSYPGTGYGYASGTSMASPHVVGAIALLWSARSELHGQIHTAEDIINTTAVSRYSTQCGDPPQTMPNNVYGWGRVDAFAAVHAVVMSGKVLDEDGGSISGATIRAEIQPGTVWETLSDAEGLYNLYPVSGTYTVTFSKPAYVTRAYTDIILNTAETTMLSGTLTQSHSFLPSMLHTPEW